MCQKEFGRDSVRRFDPMVNTFIILCCVGILFCTDVHAADEVQQPDTEAWTFCSIPDFLNFDIEYPQEGWEDALGFILNSMKKENPAFVMVAGDLVMGHWGPTKEDVNKWADVYYPQWTKRWVDHNLKVYAALGDHEIGDNPWHGNNARLVPHYKEAFRRHLKMPLNGPDHMKGTAFYWLHNNALFVSVDVFEAGKSKQGEIAAGVTGAQLKWFEGVLKKLCDASSNCSHPTFRGCSSHQRNP